MAATAMPVVPVADELPENQQNYRETIAADQALYTQRQRQLHDAAAMRHVANDVFTPHARLRKVTQGIDDFCRDDSMNESKPPLVLVGEVGSGKSCILANWVRERRLRGRGVSSGNVQEFVFLHVAGCSRDSTTVSNLLFRIVTEIKHHFGLQVRCCLRAAVRAARGWAVCGGSRLTHFVRGGGTGTRWKYPSASRSSAGSSSAPWTPRRARAA